jgi:hypothetical protein
MRGAGIQQDNLFSTVIPGERVPPDHPLRPIREMVNTALEALDADFNAMYGSGPEFDSAREASESAAVDGILYDTQ